MSENIVSVDLDMGNGVDQPGVPIKDSVYNIIKTNILNWNLKPGVRISEKEMSDILKVSKTPVRESFIRLSNEGFVDIFPQRGSFISKINLKDVNEGLFIRLSLELSVIDIAVDVIKDDVILELNYLLEKQKAAISNKDYILFMKNDEEFHKKIFFACEKERTWQFMREANAQYTRLRMLTLIDIDKYNDILKEHEAILNGIIKHDAKIAESAVKKHIKKLYLEEEILKEKYPDYFI